jgi:hypothetical protein
MTEKFCGLCQRRHWYQATPEVSAPRRETPRDFWLGVLGWVVIAAAYASAAYWVASR